MRFWLFTCGFERSFIREQDKVGLFVYRFMIEKIDS